MTNTDSPLDDFEISSWVEGVFSTSATDKQLKLRLVKNIQAYCHKQVIEARIDELERLDKEIFLGAINGKFDGRYLSNRKAKLRKTL